MKRPVLRIHMKCGWSTGTGFWLCIIFLSFCDIREQPFMLGRIRPSRESSSDHVLTEFCINIITRVQIHLICYTDQFDCSWLAKLKGVRYIVVALVWILCWCKFFHSREPSYHWCHIVVVYHEPSSSPLYRCPSNFEGARKYMHIPRGGLTRWLTFFYHIINSIVSQ